MKKAGFAGAILVLLGAGLYSFLNQKQSDPAPKTVSTTRKIFLSSRPAVVKDVTKPKVIDGCEGLTSSLENLDLNLPMKDWIEDVETQALGTCVAPEFAERVASLKKDCFDKVEETSCFQDVFFLRALLRTRHESDPSDRELLADMVIRQFAKKEMDFKKLKELSEKLLDLNPNDPGIQKLWAASKVIEKIGKDTNPMDVADDVNARIDPALWNEPQMQGLKLALATGLKPEGVEEYVRGYLTQKQEPQMVELLGWSLWKQGRRAEAIEQLETALKLNPHDPWLQEQAVRVRARGAGEEAYQARLSIGVNFQDLYQ